MGHLARHKHVRSSRWHGSYRARTHVATPKRIDTSSFPAEISDPVHGTFDDCFVYHALHGSAYRVDHSGTRITSGEFADGNGATLASGGPRCSPGGGTSLGHRRSVRRITQAL